MRLAPSLQSVNVLYGLWRSGVLDATVEDPM